MIEGVEIVPKKKICDDRGMILHMLQETDPEFERFGQVYASCVYPGVVKGWHLHKKLTLNYIVPVGMIKFVLYDDREDSKTRGELMEIYLGQDDYKLVKVPPFVWNGFKGIGTQMAMVVNVTDYPNDPDEIVRADPHGDTIEYDWATKDR